jgi:hypothetical protein
MKEREPRKKLKNYRRYKKDNIELGDIRAERA